jgi:hypothetical protein
MLNESFECDDSTAERSSLHVVSATQRYVMAPRKGSKWEPSPLYRLVEAASPRHLRSLPGLGMLKDKTN